MKQGKGQMITRRKRKRTRKYKMRRYIRKSSG